MTLGPSVVPAAFQGEDHLMRAVQIEGDPRLANEVLFLFRHLRWDVEEDLARVLGDAAAHRVASTARQFVSWQKEALLARRRNLMDYALEERQLIAHRVSFEEHRSTVAQLRDALERLEKRLDRLAG
jgi:ubiquinone biosynthesis protein UbiJ